MLIAPIIVLALADRDEAVETSEAALEEAHRRGSLFSVSGLHMWHGFVLTRRGDLAEAEAVLRTAIDEFVQWGFAEQAMVYLSAFLARCAPRARRRRRRSRRPRPRGRSRRPVRRGPLLAQQRDGAARRRGSRRGRGRDGRRASRSASPTTATRRTRAGAPARRRRSTGSERGEEAIALAEEELELARGVGRPGAASGATLRILGTLEREDGLDDLRAAVEVLEGSAARLELAKALAALGSALRRSRRRRKRASRCAGRWSWRARARRRAWSSTCAASCTRPGPARGATPPAAPRP